MLGGIKCIANDVSKLDKSFIIFPEISPIIMDFCEAFDIEDYNTKTNITSRLAIKINIEHQMWGNLLIISWHSMSVLTNSGWVFNVVTIKVWNHRLTEKFLFHKTIGKELFDKFRKLRFEGQKSIWEHYKNKTSHILKECWSCHC